MDHSPGAGFIHADTDLFRKVHKSGFAFRHRLASCKLFELPRLATAAEKILSEGDASKFVVLSGGEVTAGTKFTEMKPQELFADKVRRLADVGGWIKLSSLELVDQEYAEVLKSILGEIQDLSGQPLLDQITWSALTVFLSSPNVVTPYHIDHESNFLFQIRGEKDISLFDPDNRSILSEREIEEFYAGNFQAARFTEEVARFAQVHHLAPGIAVHNPPLGPHWVKNGNDISISVSIGFCLRSQDLKSHVYQVNHYLRKLGIHPNAPGRFAFSDRLKMAGIDWLSKSKPETHDEVLFSGLNRLRSLANPLQAVRRAK